MLRWLFGLTIWSFVLLLIGFMATSQAQQQKCGSYDELIGMMSNQYHEIPFAEGTVETPRGDLPFQIFANPDTRTWTAFVTPQPGIACIIFAGQNWGPASPLSHKGDKEAGS